MLDVMVRLCFLVKVRKATGRRVDGGRRIGSIDTLPASEVGLPTRTGRAGGVPKAGDEEGAMSCTAAFLEESEIFGVLVELSILLKLSFSNERFKDPWGIRQTTLSDENEKTQQTRYQLISAGATIL